MDGSSSSAKDSNQRSAPGSCLSSMFDPPGVSSLMFGCADRLLSDDFIDGKWFVFTSPFPTEKFLNRAVRCESQAHAS